MAVLRLTSVALVACSAAAADPPPLAHGPPPDGWTQLPAIAAAVSTAATIERTAVDAWGEPARGCYAVWLDLRGPGGDAPALADQVLAGMTGLTGLTLAEVAKPDGVSGLLSFAFARPPYRGRLRARLGAGRIAAAACFGNQREPKACDAACVRVLEDVR